jgi:hypothetical protein
MFTSKINRDWLASDGLAIASATPILDAAGSW